MTLRSLGRREEAPLYQRYAAQRREWLLVGISVYQLADVMVQQTQ